MQSGRLTVGTSATLVPVTLTRLRLGLRLLGRAANSGTVYLGSTSAVTTSTGVLIPNGDPGTTFPFVVPADHYGSSPGTVYLIASGAGQLVDWSAV